MCKNVTMVVKPKPSAIAKITSKVVRKCLLQFHQVSFKMGVLYWSYINNDVQYHQLVLPKVYHTTVLQKIHDDCSHQGLNWTLSLA